MTQCPSADQLERMLDEQLTDADQHGITLHVKTCAICQGKLEELTADTEMSGGSCTLVVRRHAEASSENQTMVSFLARLKDTSASVLLEATPLGPDGAALPRQKRELAHTNGVPTVAGYEIELEIGRGGMGVVYKARQTGLNRSVALKMILAGPHARPKDLARFRQEAEAVASLHHPNIVQIYDIGEADGIPYLVLEYVGEGNLVQHLRGDPQELKPAVRLMETLARTVHFAHQQGVVHRDLKPANILLAPSAGSSQSSVSDTSGAELGPILPGLKSPLRRGHDFAPKITDFGLAKRLDDASPTPSGEIVGTPSYMAPEQAGGKSNLVGPTTDVYALAPFFTRCSPVGLPSRERRRWTRSCKWSMKSPCARAGSAPACRSIWRRFVSSA